jgi:predicted Zn-dependent protease
MQDYFNNLADALIGEGGSDEMLLLNLAGEDSDFVRFNRSAIRQAGSVQQNSLTVELIAGQRHASETFTLTGEAELDLARARQAIEALREQLPQLAEDPYLLVNTDPTSTEQVGPNDLPETDDAIAAVLEAGQGRDLVGLLAGGCIRAGFANSLGQRNWFASHSFSLDWSFYAHDDKAVKAQYAGFAWSDEEFAQRVASALEQLDLLGKEPITIDPGEYRTYLAPPALAEFLEMVSYTGFALKAHRTRNTCLLKMIEAGLTLDDRVTLAEHTAAGIGPNFSRVGYVLPDRVGLIEQGKLAQPLVSPRSGKEYDRPVNAGSEVPEALDLAPGEFDAETIPQQLSEGVLANQLWYLNYSDLAGGRITGMTRFGTFWVEGGNIVAPLNVMRFDETVFRALGENLLGLTRQREFLPDTSTYEQRSTASARLPGALIDRFQFTL